jgi:hypothetical protein
MRPNFDQSQKNLETLALRPGSDEKVWNRINISGLLFVRKKKIITVFHRQNVASRELIYNI